MVAVLSTMQELGSIAHDFSLPDVTANDALFALSEAKGKPLLLMFICNHCPYVIHVIEELTKLANRAVEQGFTVVAISANDVESYPQDGPQPMREFAQQYGFRFPYLYDEQQSVAKACKAACTPDFFVYSADHRLTYRGQMDNSRPGNGKPVTGAELQAGLVAAMKGESPTGPQIPGMGCNIKWRPGNEPDYC